MEKYGVPPVMVSVVKSFHEEMNAEVRVGSSSTDVFDMNNDVHQGCTLAPTLFDLYFNVIVST